MFCGGSAAAQQQTSGGPEGIEIGLSTDRVSITADFTGADLTIFGALDNADPLVSRQGRYDVIVVLEGPPRPVVVRRKDRILGMWINVESDDFRQRAGVLFGGDHARAAGHHRTEESTASWRSAPTASTCSPRKAPPIR